MRALRGRKTFFFLSYKKKWRSSYRFSGPYHGLKLVLNLETDYYLGRGVTEKEGARVIVHPSELTPLTATSGGFSIQSGVQV